MQMRTQIVYSLVSDSNDNFLEQLLISTYSVKLHNKEVHIVLVIDEESDKSLTSDRQKALVYIDEKIVVKTPELGKKSRSRWLKTSIRQIVKGDYLFIDTDTIIAGDLSEIDNIDSRISAVLDRHLSLDKNQRGEAIIKQCRKSGWNPEEKDYKYFNSGVMLVKECPEAHELYKKWHEIWESSYNRGIDIDQPALGLANKRVGYVIHELGGTWNCQVLGNGLRFMHDAKIIHYYNTDNRTSLHSNPYIFSNKNFQNIIKENKYVLSDDLMKLVSSPYSQFSVSNEIIADEKLNVYNSPTIQFLMIEKNRQSIPYLFLNLFILIFIHIKMIIKKFFKA